VRAAAVRTALITGAGRGIGLATAKAFLAAGWRVLALDKTFDAFDATGNVERIEYDLTGISGIAALVESLGVIDTLVNNAGVLYCDPYASIPEAHQLEILAVNLQAPVALITAVSPQMIARKEGRIVNVGSVAAFTGHPDLWYGITKAGLLNLTKSWATQLGPHGVLINAVAPGPTHSDMYEQLPQSRKDMVSRSVYSGRAARPAEVAETILWLGTLSPEYVNGTTLDCNNGSYPR
jgi:NAD(P)-dependent dehydrogenase (short-subunit alcohol dehydrogenase family)